MRRSFLPLLAALLLAAPAAAQQHPNVARGFGSSGTFSTGDVDSVNLFNGNLVIRIPLGMTYPVNAGLSYQLGLIYNNNVWDHQQRETETITYTQSIPNRTSNAGLGWMVSLGRLNPPTSNEVDSNRTVYMSPDGALHSFYPTLHEGEATVAGVAYTRDGTYLRYKAGPREIEFPDGMIHSFGLDGLPTQIRDRFGNQVNIDYSVAGEWRISDTHNRLHRVIFRSDLPGFANGAVSRIELGAFGGATAIWSFLYSNDEGVSFTVTGCRNSDPLTQSQAVALLTQVTLPDGSTYRMPVADHGTQTTVPCNAGMLRGMTLPTLGRIEWDYMQYSFPLPSSSRLYRQSSSGVSRRRLKDAAGGTLGEWQYRTALTSDPNFAHAQELVNTVITPLGDKTEHFFSVSTSTGATTTWNAFEYGLPFSRYEIDGGSLTRYRSSKVYDCDPGSPDPVNCFLKRSNFVRYEWDAGGYGLTQEENSRRNQRLLSPRTNYDDGKLAAVVYGNFDGLGHYREINLYGSFGAGDTRSTFINYNPGRGTYPGSFTPPADTDPWVLHTFTESTETEASVRSKVEYCFNASTGFLERKRVLVKTDLTRSGADVVVRYTPVNGNVKDEESFGGDGAGLDTASPLCSMLLPANQYRTTYTYQHGTLRTSQSSTGGTGLFSFKDLDRDIDPTGLIWKSRDTSGLYITTYEYDTLGRPTFVKPAQDGWTRHSYVRATSASALARVDTDQLAGGGAAVLAQSRLRLDSLGRPWREEQRMPDGTWSLRETFYNALGWRTSVSELDAVGRTTSFLNYDPFGRPGIVRPPDGGAHDVIFTYTGVSSVERKPKVATTYNASTGTASETVAATTESYDRQGRLIQVTEPNGAITRYEYDIGNRLKRVCQGPNGTLCAQERLFNYDNRGFLLEEKHPEKGPSGNGTVSYLNIDSRGHARRTIDGPHDLTYTIDRAERVSQIAETGGRLLKTFTYGTAVGNSLSDARNGKLVQAQRYNYPLVAGVGHTVVVTETYVYGGRDGRVSRRDTSNTFNGSQTEIFNQFFTWNDLGQLATLDYPQCAFAACASTPRTVSHTYTNGFLTAVPNYTGTVPGQAAGVGITYHSNGMIHQIAHGNGVVVTHAKDPNSMVRPASITAALGATTLWSTGTYQYDGSGNIWKIGSSWFDYDSLSRLEIGAVFPDPLGGGTQQKQTYAYDNYGNVNSITAQIGTTTATTRNTPTSASTNRLTGAVYDAAGNMTSWNGATYEYDAFNQLVHMVSGAEDWAYIYTADDERFWAYRHPTAAGEQRYDIFTLRDLDGKVLRQFSNPGYTWTSWEDYIYRDGQLLAGYLSNGQRRHFHLDHLGSPRLVTNVGGLQVGYHVYYPFGEEATPFNPGMDRMKFTGHERDLASMAGVNPAADDLDYMHARHYGLLTGRFTSFDPVGGSPGTPQSWNRYAYVLGNLVRFIDPEGLQPVEGYYYLEGTFGVSGTYQFNTADRLYYGGLRFHGLLGIASSNPGPSKDYASQVFAGVWARAGWVAQAADEGARLVDLATGWASAVDALLKGDPSEAGLAAATALIPGPLDNAAKAALRFTPDQQALIALAKEAQRKGVTRAEAKILETWAKEYKVLFRGPEAHPGRKFGRLPHIHVGTIDHIRVR
jgi:RHS repeat-associated protein